MLFQKKQPSYQNYKPTISSSNRTKITILIGLGIFSIIIIILSFFMRDNAPKSNPASSRKELTQYVSKSPGLRFSIYAPNSYTINSKGFEVDITGPNSSDSIKLKKILPSSEGKWIAETEKVVTKDISGKALSNIKSQPLNIYGKEVLYVTDVDIKNVSEYYTFSGNYVWQIELSWSENNKVIPQFAREIVNSFETKDISDDKDYLKE